MSEHEKDYGKHDESAPREHPNDLPERTQPPRPPIFLPKKPGESSSG